MEAQGVQYYFLPFTNDAPNSRLPVPHYKGVLPKPLNEDSATDFLAANQWEKRERGGHIGIRHFHPNSHECYAIFSGTSTMLLGNIASTAFLGLRVEVQAGDVIVMPAGTAHSSLESSSDYRYIGVYPQGCPKWRAEFGKAPAQSFLETTRTVAVPEMDPVYGEDGALIRLWCQRGSSKL